MLGRPADQEPDCNVKLRVALAPGDPSPRCARGALRVVANARGGVRGSCRASDCGPARAMEGPAATKRPRVEANGAASGPAAGPGPASLACVCKVFTSRVEPHFAMPWQMRPQRQATHDP